MGRKAVFLDVDGTYVNDRGVVPESARRAVVAARANGHQVFLCTGRAVAELWDHIVEAGFDGLIASAGGYVELDGQVLLHRSISEDGVRHVVEFFDTHGVEYYLEANSGLYGSRNSKSRLRELVFAGVSDEGVLAELEKGLGPFIDSLIVDQDLVRSDINKVSFLDSDLPSTGSARSSPARCTSFPRRSRCLARTAGRCPSPGSTRPRRSSCSSSTPA